MHGKGKSFTLYLTGVPENDRGVERYVRENGYADSHYILFKLEYAPPFAKFSGISEFERTASMYRPFEDEIRHDAVAAIDFSEWLGHENEEYLKDFFKFLHDYDWSYYSYEYLMVVGSADLKKSKKLFVLAAEYLEDSAVECDNTFSDEKKMSDYLVEHFPISRELGNSLSPKLVKAGLSGYSQLDNIMNDFVKRVPHRTRKLTLLDSLHGIEKLEESKFAMVFENEFLNWKKELLVIPDVLAEVV